MEIDSLIDHMTMEEEENALIDFCKEVGDTEIKLGQILHIFSISKSKVFKILGGRRNEDKSFTIILKEGKDANLKDKKQKTTISYETFKKMAKIGNIVAK